MALNTDERQNVVYFTGYEVEHTICHGMKTLFVVSTPPAEEIIKLAREQDCPHIYFGTSQSFKPRKNFYEDWKQWEDAMLPCLKENFWVTLDFDVSYADQFHNSPFCEYDRFVPMISVKLPYIRLFNYNTTIKLDDITWGKTNSGVWTHQLNDLLTKEKYTYWDQYTKDTELK